MISGQFQERDPKGFLDAQVRTLSEKGSARSTATGEQF
jgi:hypothetical protein